VYLDRLRPESGFLALAIEGDAVVGYAFVCIEHGPDDTFPVGDRYAELYSLSVAPDRRGRGIGTQLLDFVDRELARRSVRDLKVAVMAGNTDARRFYERRGLGLGELVLYRFGSDGVQNAQ
jgi:ribosomal protein S18 acetylase RimI-like enzyme